MPNTRKKKRIEKIHIEYLKEFCSDLPIPVDDDVYDENPDFLRKHISGVLGIEHTRLFKTTKHPNAPQALESFRQQIVESAQKCYDCDKDNPPLYVQVHFKPNQAVPKNRKPEIVRISIALAEFVKKWHKNNPSKTDEILKPHFEIPEIFLISITRSWNSKTHLWTVEAPAMVHHFPIKRIQNCINKKNIRYKEYLKRCDECWLLIEVDTFRDSQSFEMPDPIKHRFESKFERVFYLDASHRKDLRELSIIRIKS